MLSIVVDSDTLTAVDVATVSFQANSRFKLPSAGGTLEVGSASVVVQGAGDAFNGEYLIVGVSHRFDGDSNGGWHTLLRLVREDRAVYVLPEVGDEVLVAFEHGDLVHPVVVGSLWDDQPRQPDEAPLCGPGASRR